MVKQSIQKIYQTEKNKTNKRSSNNQKSERNSNTRFTVSVTGENYSFITYPLTPPLTSRKNRQFINKHNNRAPAKQSTYQVLFTGEGEADEEDETDPDLVDEIAEVGSISELLERAQNDIGAGIRVTASSRRTNTGKFNVADKPESRTGYRTPKP